MITSKQVISTGFIDLGLGVWFDEEVKDKKWRSFQPLVSSGGTTDDPKNSKLPTWFGCFGFQQCAGGPNMQFLFYVIKILPSYLVT